MLLSEPDAKVFLVGFMGTGKTTLGRRLAERLGWRFEDLDSAIEEDEGASVVRIFTEKGEASFRETEKLALVRLAALPGQTVIACGGGTFCDAENRALMHQSGVTVWLDQPFEQIWARRAALASTRPLLETEAGARSLYERRTAIYQGANLHLRVADGGFASALTELMSLIGWSPHSPEGQQ